MRNVTRRTLLAGGGLAVSMALLGRRAAGETEAFRLIRARTAQVRLRGAEQEPTRLATYDGAIPGPVLRVRRGEELKVRIANELSGATAVHWHGVRGPNAMDGVPPLTQKPIEPGASFDCRFTPPDAGTFWYHAPVRAGEDRGLQGLLIVDEAAPVHVDRDLALMLDAWPLDPAGAIDPAARPAFTINGLGALDIPVNASDRVRLRLVNAATDRFITLRIDEHPVTVMAIDGQPAEPFRPRESRVTLSPGNRVDLFLDAVLLPGSAAPIVLEGVDVPIARLIYDPVAPPRARPRADPQPLPPNPLPERMDFRSALRIEMPLVPGALAEKALFSVKRGRVVMLALANRSTEPSVLHIHGHHVRLLDALDDGWKPFWLDTILCVPQKTTRVAFVADNPGRWLLGARAIGTDVTTQAWFEVV